MRLLDLFCGAGGAAVGYHRAGFSDIVGIDNVPQPNYPFTFIQADALNPPVDLDAFDLIHASPPCQAFSVATAEKGRHPDLIEPVRTLIASMPSVIENVPGAPLRRDVVLCGSMFGLEVRRHRVFELSGFPLVLVPACNHRGPRPYTVAGNPQDNMPWHARRQNISHRYKYRDTEHARLLMDMPWAQTNREITEAIPPAYTEYIGAVFLDQLARTP